MNKKVLSLLTALVFVLSAFCGAFAQENTDTPVPENYRGVWVCERAEIRMIRADMGYKALIHWGASFNESVNWEYTLRYDAAEDCLADAGTGVKTTLVFNNDGTEASSTEAYNNGTARFRLTDGGKLLWEDAVEDAGKDMEFERVDYEGFSFPTQQDLVDGYFHVIGGYHAGTAGSSLAEAKAAYQVFDFAQAHQIWNEDVPTLRADLLAAWESMSDEERSAFDANFISVVRLIDRCLDDWDAIKGQFGDAGVDVDRMGALLKRTDDQVSWSTLVAHTLTMGNSEN